MKAEDVKLGMKVVPHSKTIGIFTDLSNSKNWKRALAKNQPFLWVVDINTMEGCFGLCDINRSESYDRFLAEEFEPYVDDNKKRIEDALNYTLPNGKLLGEHLIFLTQDNEELEGMLLKLQEVGSDAFISSLPEESLIWLRAAIAHTSRFKPAPVKKWEYLTIQEHRMSPLSSYGREGWELVTIVGDTFYFKRPCNG